MSECEIVCVCVVFDKLYVCTMVVYWCEWVSVFSAVWYCKFVLWSRAHAQRVWKWFRKIYSALGDFRLAGTTPLRMCAGVRTSNTCRHQYRRFMYYWRRAEHLCTPKVAYTRLHLCVCGICCWDSGLCVCVCFLTSLITYTYTLESIYRLNCL